MDDIKNRIEAILFTTGRFMTVDEIAQLCGIGSIGMLKEALQALVNDYNTRNTSLEIFEDGGKYKLNIKKSYNYLTTKLLDSSELDRPTQETLAIIAYKQPSMQSDVIKIRGTGAYDHIKILREQEFITSEKHGRTRALKLAPKFFEYFDVVEDQLKEKLGEIEQKVGTVEEVQGTLVEHTEKPESGITENKEEAALNNDISASGLPENADKNKPESDDSSELHDKAESREEVSVPENVKDAEENSEEREENLKEMRNEELEKKLKEAGEEQEDILKESPKKEAKEHQKNNAASKKEKADKKSRKKAISQDEQEDFEL